MMMRFPISGRRQVCGLTLVLLVVAGCTTGEVDGLPREAVGGVVTLDGQPLPSGVIRFRPQAQGATEGGALVRDGEFFIDRESGLVPGQYMVSINASQSPGAPGQSGQAVETGGGRVGRPSKERIPDRYNSKTELKAEIKGGGSNKDLKFELSSK